MKGDCIPASRLRPGYTIFELLIVCTLIGLVLLIAMPRLNVSRMRTEAASRSAMMAMLGAQRAAVQRQYDIVVAFDTVNGRIRVHSDANNDGAIDTGEPVNTIELEKGVAFGPGPATARPMGGAAVTFSNAQGGWPSVTFTRAGNANDFGGFYLRANRAGAGNNEILAFEVDRGTGRTSRWIWYKGTWNRGF
jgi:type II secretory pathway pseudopilin PulG